VDPIGLTAVIVVAVVGGGGGVLYALHRSGYFTGRRK
jgi:hypothetical protein